MLLAVAACEEPPAEPRPAVEPTPGEVAQRVVSEAVGIPATDVEVLSVTPETFSDSSLGCPEPGMAYAQVLTAGHQVLTEANGRRFDVRVAGRAGRVCRRPKSAPIPPGTESAATDTQALADAARSDLAARLGIDADTVQALKISSWRPGTALTGCSIQCQPDASQCGYLVTLMADQRRYTYHADAARVQPCPPLNTR